MTGDGSSEPSAPSVPPVLAELGTVHLIGIGGAGMSVVARLLTARGVRVQGSDAKGSAVVEALRADGVPVHVGHAAANVEGADTLVLSSAVRPDNPELVAARAAGLRVLHRSEALAALMAQGRAVAVAGAHGKTTTSAMIATTLRSAGLDPSFAIGGSVITSDGAIPGGWLGAGDVLVAEADESDGSFLNYAPTIAVVLNVEPDHLDHYGSRAAFEQACHDGHARAADADEVDGPQVLERRRCHRGTVAVRARHRELPAAFTTRSATRAVASWTPAREASEAMVRSRSPSVTSAGTFTATHGAVNASSSTRMPPPARTSGPALSRCSPLPMGSGT